jgi:molecular chaperone DnaK
VDVRNQADTLIAVSEKTLKDAGDKAKAEDKTLVEEKVKALKDIKDKDDVEAIRKGINELSDAIQKVGAAMYQAESSPAGSEASTAANAAGGAQPGPDSTQGPVDADFKEVPKE